MIADGVDILCKARATQLGQSSLDKVDAMMGCSDGRIGRDDGVASGLNQVGVAKELGDHETDLRELVGLLEGILFCVRSTHWPN